MIQTAPAGIATATQQSQLHTAGENIHLVSGANTDISAGQSLTAHAAESVNLFAQSNGIKVQANQGKVEVQAQNDELQLNALKDATLTSSAGKITIAAKEEILITCKGAYIKLSNGEVEIGSPKVVRVRAPLVVSGSNQINHFIPPMNQKAPTWLAFQYLDSDMQPIPSVKYKAYFKTGEIVKGTTDENGFYEFDNPPSDIIKLVMDEEPLKPKQEKLQDFLVQVKGELK